MADLLQTCLGDVRREAPQATPDDITKYYCVRCKTVDCERSGWRDDPLSRRVRTQVERLLHAEQADPSAPKYAPVVRNDFVDQREQAEAWSRRATPAAGHRGVLRQLPAQQVWEVGRPQPAAPAPAAFDPWDPRSGNKVAGRATVQFREDGTLTDKESR